MNSDRFLLEQHEKNPRANKSYPVSKPKPPLRWISAKGQPVRHFKRETRRQKQPRHFLKRSERKKKLLNPLKANRLPFFTRFSLFYVFILTRLNHNKPIIEHFSPLCTSTVVVVQSLWTDCVECPNELSFQKAR